MSVDFKKGLNAEQFAAVMAPDGPVLVIAAAGTGKTRTLTYRVAHLVERGVPADRILLLTFTNRAAHEMLERAQALVGEAVGGLWGGTFHHMANRLLRRYADLLGYSNDYTILDQDDSRRLVRACAEELDLLGKHFPKPDVLLSVFGMASSTERAVADVASDRFKLHDINVTDVERVHSLYEERKRRSNGMDFDDLLKNGLLLFRNHAQVRERYQEKFLHILVDEYQDTNTIQSEWVDTLADRHRNLLVVGDDFQSIYSWRGANYRNILTFPSRYSDARIFKLETNYRSVPEILHVANACIAGNPEQFQKNLHSVREEYKKPVLAELRDGGAQARYVIDKIRQLRREGYPSREIAVLYRSHFHAMELQLELARAGVPYVITSGARFFEQVHIKDVCAVLRLLSNPSDELSFLRLMEFLPRVGRRTAVKIWNTLGRRFDLKSAEDINKLGPALPKAARESGTKLQKLFTDIQTAEVEAKPPEVIQHFVTEFYDDYAIETFENYDRRIEDIQGLVTFSAAYATTDDFLSEMALLTNLDAESDRPGSDDDDVIRLSTIHQAKGLEWNVVFVLWLADGMFPSARSMDDAGGEAEERRLFYVATTRARDELYLCVPQVRRARDGSVSFCTTSRFIDELDEELLRRDYVGFV